MTSSRYQIDWVLDVDSWSNLRDDWDHIYRSDGRQHPFLHWEWCRDWYFQYAQADWSPVIGVVRRNNECVGIIPWYSHVIRRGMKNFKIISSLGTGEVSPPWIDVIGERKYWSEIPPLTIKSAFSQIEWDILDHSPIVAGTLFEKYLLSAFDAQRVELNASDVAPIIELGGNFDKWLSTLGGSTRKDLRRKISGLLASQDLQVMRRSTKQEVMDALPRLVDLNRLRLHSLGKRGAFHLANFTDFHLKIAPKFAEMGSCEIFEIRLHGRTIAAQLYYGNGETRYSYLSGMAPDATSVGPGAMLDVEIFCRLMNDPDIHQIDLGVGEQEYKFRYGASRRTTQRITVFRTTIMRHFFALRRSALRQLNRTPMLSKGSQP